MTPRHALQAAAKQFGNDGTDRSLADLLTAVLALPVNETPATGIRRLEAIRHALPGAEFERNGGLDAPDRKSRDLSEPAQ